MKKIEKQIEKTIIETEVQYEAFDGETFNDENVCKQYESTAAATLLHKLKDITINTHDYFEWFEDSDENQYKIVVPTKEKHIDTMNMLWRLFGGGGELKKENLFSEDDINKVIMIGYRIYNGSFDWVWFWKFDDMVKDATANKYKLVKNEENK